MSDTAALQEATLRTVDRIVPAVASADVPGLTLTRMIATPQLDHLDPFLLLSDFWPASPDQPVGGFPDHPHRGFETVTYMIGGRMRHRDHTGAAGVIGPGAVQWMTAGRGIVHSEVPEPGDGDEGDLRGFQLWVNLPAADKMCPPAYQEYAADEVPEVTPAAGVALRVIAGAAGGVTGPVQGIAVDPHYLDIALAAGAAWTASLPRDHAGFVYVIDGQANIGGDLVDAHHLAVLSGGEALSLSADDATRLLLIAARPLNEPVARYGPFVMNTEDEIHQAFRDYQEGRFV